MQIQWFPGHMAKARKQVAENLKLVDLVIELLDARIPHSSRNPMIKQILGDKPRLVVLNKADLADDQATNAWIKWFATTGVSAVALNSLTGQGLKQIPDLAQAITEPVMATRAAKGMRPRAIRAMIVGIPNVGKSSLINRLTGGNRAKTGDKPGVTRGPQWVKINPDFELLDTAGILWPKFDDPEVGVKLAVTGAISDLVLDVEELAVSLLQMVQNLKPVALQERFKLTELPGQGEEILTVIGQRRGCLIAGGNIDRTKAAILSLKEFRAGLWGKITLDMAQNYRP
ncbi:MAG: ribosome biogenesis GTPase YlqF [Peptococcaceae bacterium]|nr:ribosome biogenesis GTPase YlqF [Peptococcaceae bacterium]